LVDLTRVTAPTAGHQDPAPPTPQTRPAQPQHSRTDQPGRQGNPPPLDIAQIVDTVHRKFLRRLAVETERRAVR
jgi:hypothetical protein